jgi:uncharacterized protein (DUF362 family)
MREKMKIHPLLRDPNSVLVFQAPVSGSAGWNDFRRAAFQALQVMQIELEGEKVVIKPNVTSGERIAEPDSGITTHPGFIHGMVEYLQNSGTPTRSITIVEDPRDTDDNEARHWLGTGYERVAQENGIRLHCPTTYTCVKKDVPNREVFDQINVSRLAVAPNSVVFNVPKLKTHNLAITTLGMKNLMGLVNVFDRHYCLQAWEELPEEISTNPNPRRSWFTEEMHEAWQTGLARRLVDTARVIQPALTIIEGVVGREGTGFQRGQNRALGLVVAGVNVVAADSAASYIMGFDPQNLIYLKLAGKAGLGTNEIDRLRFYTSQNDELVPCQDPAALRVSPPFRVIRNIKGEQEVQFSNEALVVEDASESFFNISPA